MKSTKIKVTIYCYFRLRERTFSLWAYLRKNKRQFINPFYKEFEPSDGILIPNIQPQNIK